MARLLLIMIGVAAWAARPVTTIPDDLITANDLAKIRPITRRRFNWLRESGKVQTYRIGRRVFVSLAEVDGLVTVERAEGPDLPTRAAG